MVLAQMQLFVHLLSWHYWRFSAFTTFHYLDSYVNKVPYSWKLVLCSVYFTEIGSKKSTCAVSVPPSEDSCPEGSIDLKCKERVTDSDEDEPDGEVARMNYNQWTWLRVWVWVILSVPLLILYWMLRTWKEYCIYFFFFFLDFIQ